VQTSRCSVLGSCIGSGGALIGSRSSRIMKSAQVPEFPHGASTASPLQLQSMLQEIHTQGVVLALTAQSVNLHTGLSQTTTQRSNQKARRIILLPNPNGTWHRIKPVSGLGRRLERLHTQTYPIDSLPGEPSASHCGTEKPFRGAPTWGVNARQIQARASKLRGKTQDPTVPGTGQLLG